MRERDDKRSTRAPESCGWREAPAAKPLGVRFAIAGRAGRHPAGGRVREGTTLVGETVECAQEGECRGLAFRFDGEQGNADVKHKAVRLEAGRERAEDKDLED